MPRLKFRNFEHDLKVISDSEYAGQLLYSLAQLTRFLNAVSESVEALSDDVCGPPMIFLKRQFEVHYLQIIQPYMARINVSAYQILPLMAQIANMGALVTKALKGYLALFSIDKKDSYWNQYQRASQRHARAWSMLFDRCNVSKEELNG